MEPTQELIRSLRRERIEDARQMDPVERLFAGADLYEYACSITLDAIRSQNPDFTEEQVRAELRRRFAIAERREARQ